MAQMPDNDDSALEPAQKPGNDQEISGPDELLYALADSLRTKQSKEAIALLIRKYAEDIKPKAQRRLAVTIVAYVAALLIIGGVGVMAHSKVISSETAGTVIGIVVGSMFRPSRSN